MICELPSSLIARFVKPMLVDFLSSISGNTLSSYLRASHFLTPMGFFSSSASSLRAILITGSYVHVSLTKHELHLPSMSFMLDILLYHLWTHLRIHLYCSA